MIVSGLNENESQEREQGGIMWREIEFHLYRGHLLTLRFLGGNGAERSLLSLCSECISELLFFFFFTHVLSAFRLSVKACSYPLIPL